MTYDRFAWLMWDMDCLECLEFNTKPLTFDMYKEQYGEWLHTRYAQHVNSHPNAEEELPAP